MYFQDTSLQVLLIFYLDSTQPNFTPKMEGIFLDLGAESSSKFFALFPRFPFISKVGKDPWDTRGGKGPIWGRGGGLARYS